MTTLTNKNEYRINNRLYLKTIQTCHCVRKSGPRYFLTCKIPQRGEREYCLSENMDFIQSPHSTRTLWFSPPAKNSIRDAIHAFEANKIRALTTFTRVEIEEMQITLFYSHTSSCAYDFLLVKNATEKEWTLHFGTTIGQMIRKLSFLDMDPRDKDASFIKTEELLRQSTRKNIEENPLYRSALENKDILLQKQIALVYNLATEKDCAWLSKALRTRILPPLPKEFDREYSVDSDTISVPLLQQSGYQILHKPCFSMQGYTHALWQLNPHAKTAVDAAKKDSRSISFHEFLNEFESSSCP